MQAEAAQAKSKGEPRRPRALTPEERSHGRAKRCRKGRLEPVARPGVRGARDQHQLWPPPPSCPSPPPEPDFTPPAVRAGRNSHFAAGDPAPTTAAASVTSRRRAAGPAPPQRPGRWASGGRSQPHFSAPPSSVTLLPVIHRPPPPNLSLQPPTASSVPYLPPTQGACARARPCGGNPRITKILPSGTLKVWGGLSRRARRHSGLATPKDPKHAAQSQRSALTAGSPPCFPP